MKSDRPDPRPQDPKEEVARLQREVERWRGHLASVLWLISGAFVVGTVILWLVGGELYPGWLRIAIRSLAVVLGLGSVVLFFISQMLLERKY